MFIDPYIGSERSLIVPTVTEIELVPWNQEKSGAFLDFQKIGLSSSRHIDREGLALQREIAITAVSTRWERDTKVDPAQARACANPRLITSLTLFITALRASFASGSFSHSHHDTIAYSRGMKSTLFNSFLLTSLFLSLLSLLLPPPPLFFSLISVQCRQPAVAINRRY